MKYKIYFSPDPDEKVREFHAIGKRLWDRLNETHRTELRLECIHYFARDISPLLNALRGIMEWWGERTDEMPAELFDAAWTAIKDAETPVEPLERLDKL